MSSRTCHSQMCGNETGEAARNSRHLNANVLHGSDTEGQYQELTHQRGIESGHDRLNNYEAVKTEIARSFETTSL